MPKIFSTLFDIFRAGQKTSKIVKKGQNIFRRFSTIFARHQLSGPFWGALQIALQGHLLFFSLKDALCTLPCPSLPCFVGKRQGKPPKKQGFFIPTEPPKSLERKGKTLKKKKQGIPRSGENRGGTNRVFGKPCFCPLPKRGRFDENGENDEFAFYSLKQGSPKTTKMTKMAGVTQEKAWFSKNRVP